MCNVPIDGGDSSGMLVNKPQHNRSAVTSRKNRSTMFGHDAEVAVKCMLTRACLRSHS
ncbi:hypothetical protein ACTJLC_26790 [Paraburkholderia sp. 22099]|jgi:hypothetical protein|uniref:hypothetical protein n=1 Tax=Paraburkholderia TaxID=1822464 RepID=UPI0013565BFF|nr:MULTISPECIES: hypothetical protein [Paraburkholderia]MDR6496089.1 hypothetical protein [Paraburkholderia terricola]